MTRADGHPTPDEVDALLDGEGDPRLAAHVHGCPDCNEVLAGLRMVRHQLKEAAAGGVDGPAVPAEVAASWFAALAAEPSYPGRDTDPAAVTAGPPAFDMWPGPPGPGPAGRSVTPAGASAAGPTRRLRVSPLARKLFALAAGIAVLAGAGVASLNLRSSVDTTLAGSVPSLADTPAEAAAEAEPAPSAVGGFGADAPAAAEADAAPEPAPDLLLPAPDTTPGSSGRAGSAPAGSHVLTPADRDATVRDLVATRTMEWPGQDASGSALQARRCLASVDVQEAPLATAPVDWQNRSGQLLVVPDGAAYAVYVVEPGCPGPSPQIHLSFGVTP